MKGVVRWKIIQGRGDALELYKDWKVETGSWSPYMVAVVRFRHDLPLVMIEDSWRTQVLTGEVQGSDIFPLSIAM